MRLLITGLCLSRNLGGPAMGLTLMKAIKKRFPHSIFTFAVSPIHYDEEKKWAEVYQVNTVRMDYLPIHLLNKIRLIFLLRFFTSATQKKYMTSDFWKTVHAEFIKAYIDSDCIIDMSGVLYVGSKGLELIDALKSYTNFYYAKKHKKPFLRFTQSFGPFNSFFIRKFASMEFKHLPFIPARGKKSAEFCKVIAEPSKVYDFPDIAILLEKDQSEWYETYFSNNNLPKEYIVISPSFVINNKKHSKKYCNGENYRKVIAEVCVYLVETFGSNILFLPHTYSQDKNNCDREVCNQILTLIKNNNLIDNKVFVIKDDINPMQAKAIISNARFSIVSRYHALVASLSSGIPSIAMGWHNKYEDILEYYNFKDFCIDVTVTDPYTVLKKIFILIEKIINNNYSDILLSAHQANITKVNKSIALLYEWIEKNHELSALPIKQN